MRHTISFIFLSVASSLAMACGGHPDAQAVDPNPLLQQRKFAELEQLAAKLRAGNSLSPSGESRLLQFYTEIALASDACRGRHPTPAQLQEQEALLEEWRKASPASSTAKIATGSFQLSLAWTQRGSGYGSTVKEDQWEKFRTSMARARETLEQTVPEKERDAGWYQKMLGIAVSQHWSPKEFAALSKRATSLFPNFTALYISSAAYYTPKWHGSDEEFAAYIEDAVKRTRRTMGESLYASIQYAHRRADMYSNGTAAWPRMKSGFERITTDFPSPHNLSIFAAQACFMEDEPTLKTVLTRLGDELDPSAFSDEGRMVYCKARQHGPVQCFRGANTGKVFCEPAKQEK